MGLLSKIKSVFGFGTAKPQQPAQPKRKGKPRGHGKPGETSPSGHHGPKRSRTAKPRQGKPEERDTTRKESGEGNRSRRPHDHAENSRPRRERDGAPRRDRDRNRDRNRNRDNRRDRADRSPRNTPANVERPGGAFTAEQLKEYAAAHAAWDPASYVVPEEEGKRRFADFGLPNEILHAVADLGFQYCTPIQAQSLEHSLAGKNVAGRAQTGTGKTAAFLIAVLTDRKSVV